MLDLAEEVCRFDEEKAGSGLLLSAWCSWKGQNSDLGQLRKDTSGNMMAALALLLAAFAMVVLVTKEGKNRSSGPEAL